MIAPLPATKPPAQKNPPLISVVLAVYQGEETVFQSILSVLHQTYSHLELIAVDDGSTDGTLERLKSIQDKRLIILTQSNQGTAAARNLGISQARGEYIGFIDADDAWFPEKLAVELATIQRSGNPHGIVYSWYYGADEDNRLVNFSPPYRDRGDIFQTVLLRESVLLPSTTLFHRQVFETLGGFPADQYHEDRVFSLLACRHFPAYPTERRLVVYRQSQSGKCRSILSRFDLAVEKELSVVESLKKELSPQESEQLAAIQIRNLFYRFLMYNRMDFARQLYHRVDPKLLSRGKKGVLARLSIRSGVNWLFYCRILVQCFTKYLLLPWWRIKAASLYRNLNRVEVL